MKRRRRWPVPFALIALALAGVATGVALVAPIAGALFAAMAGVAIAADMATRPREAPPEKHAIEKVMHQVDRGRKLVIYERDTGLFAYWYVELRGNEECDRARRYGRALSLAVIEPNREGDAWAVQGRVRDWLRDGMRQSDIAGYLGNGRFLVIMPEADLEAAGAVIARMKAENVATDAGIASYPDDGETFEALYKNAAAKLPPALRHAA